MVSFLLKNQVNVFDKAAGIWSRLGSFNMGRMKLPEEKAQFEDLVGFKVRRRSILLI